MVGANLRSADQYQLCRPHLRSRISAYLSDANLTSANLSDAILNGADLRGANMSGVDLSDASLRHAELNGADLSLIVWSNTICPDVTNSDDNGNTCENNL